MVPAGKSKLVYGIRSVAPFVVFNTEVSSMVTLFVR